jgi:WD40 repeat protein
VPEASAAVAEAPAGVAADLAMADPSTVHATPKDAVPAKHKAGPAAPAVKSKAVRGTGTGRTARPPAATKTSTPVRAARMPRPLPGPTGPADPPRGLPTVGWLGMLSDAAQVAFSPDGTLIAAGCGKTTMLWDVASRECVRVLPRQGSWVTSIAFSSDGTTLATAGMAQPVTLWNLADDYSPLVLTTDTARKPVVAFSSDGTVAVTTGGDALQLWNAANGRRRRRLVAMGTAVRAVSFSPDGRLVAGASDAGGVQIWTVRTGARRAHTEHSPVLATAFSPDGRLLATGHQDKTVGLRNVSTDDDPTILRGHGGVVRSVCFSPDGRLLVSGADDKTVRVWDVATGSELRALRGHGTPVLSVAWSPDGQLVASGAWDATGRVRLWS